MNHHYKVLITTSGTGQRLGDITKYTNKTLVPLGEKPVISRIIEMYPENTTYVITLGHFGNTLKDFLQLSYPKRHFEFVKIDRYQGRGSSLGYSMLKASKSLQCPFIFHASDTIVTTSIPAPHINWVGGCKGVGTSLYRSFNVLNSKVQRMNDKGAVDPDFLHIGIVGVREYKTFWKTLKNIYKNSPNDSTLSDVHVIQEMISKGSSFEVTPFENWFDTGSVEGLMNARKVWKSHHITLEKLEESIYFFDTFVVKYFYNEEVAKERIERAELLHGLVPKIIETKKNFYAYKRIEGILFSEIATPESFKDLLAWAKKNLWKKNENIDRKIFYTACKVFYCKKSEKRINDFLRTRSIEDLPETIINDEKVPSVKKLLEMINPSLLCNHEPYQIHGDFILDNILKTKNGYSLLDWRQDFGGLLTAGDIYYDLAKLNHNLIVNHHIVNKALYSLEMNDNVVKVDILRKENLVQCQKMLFNFIEKEGLDKKTVNILTGLIWLNMSPLHHHPFDLFLFHLGKLYLWRAFHEKENN